MGIRKLGLALVMDSVKYVEIIHEGMEFHFHTEGAKVEGDSIYCHASVINKEGYIHDTRDEFGEAPLVRDVDLRKKLEKSLRGLYVKHLKDMLKLKDLDVDYVTPSRL